MPPGTTHQPWRLKARRSCAVRLYARLRGDDEGHGNDARSGVAYGFGGWPATVWFVGGLLLVGLWQCCWRTISPAPAAAPPGPSPPSNDPPGVITSESAGRRSDAYAVGARARAARPRVAPAPGTPALAPPGPAPAPEPPGPAVMAPPGPVSGPPAPGPPGAGAEGAVVVS